MIRVSDIAMAHGIQGTEEMKRIIVKHLPDMRQAKRLKPSESHLLILKSAVHAEAIEKNKKCLQEGFGEKTDPRLDSFIDYLVSNKVSHTLVETAIMEQIACVDLKDQHEYIQNHKDIQQAARKIMKTVEGCDTLAELANWHKCYLWFRTATGLFIMGIDYLVHSEYEDSLACLVECYLVNKKLEGMTPTALNRYKTMNRRGYYVNLCIQYCNEALINRYEDRENLNVVLKDVLSILIPAIKILMEKAIVFPSGEAGKSLKAIRGKWEEIDEYCKKMWMFTIENALSDNIGSHFALTKLSKDRVDVFQKDTGILALNKFYAGYMDIVRQWNSDLVEMVVVVTNMSRLDFNKKLADQQKRKEFKVLGWEPALKATRIHAMFAPMPTGRGRGILSQALPPIPVRGGRGRDQNAQVLPDTAVKAPTPPPTPPPVSTIQLVPADSPGYDSGAISDDEEEEIEPPSQVEPDTQLLIQVVQEPGLLAVPRSNSEPSSSRSSSPFKVETIAELKDALARDGDFKFLVSEELTKTKVYLDYMEKYARDQDQGGEMKTFGAIMNNLNKSKSVSTELDKKESTKSDHQETLPEDIKLSKKERKRRRKQLEREQRTENTEEDDKVSHVFAPDTQQQPASKQIEGKLDEEEDELSGKLIKKFCKTMRISGETDITDNKDQFEDIAEEVIKRAEKEFETKIIQIHSLQKEKESLQNDLLAKGKDILFHRDKTDTFMDSKSSEMLDIAANLEKSVGDKEKNDKEIEDISAQIELFNLKKLSLSTKQNVIHNRIKDLLKDRDNLETSVNLKATETYILIDDIKSAINAIEINIKEVDENITAAKQFKPQVQNVTKTENPNSKLIQFLDKSIQGKEKQLECPVCFHIAKAPIFSCSESHLVCGNCRPKLKICPECRCGYKEQKRHRYAEMLAKELETLRLERDELGYVGMS